MMAVDIGCRATAKTSNKNSNNKICPVAITFHLILITKANRSRRLIYKITEKAIGQTSAQTRAHRAHPLWRSSTNFSRRFHVLLPVSTILNNTGHSTENQMKIHIRLAVCHV